MTYLFDGIRDVPSLLFYQLLMLFSPFLSNADAAVLTQLIQVTYITFRIGISLQAPTVVWGALVALALSAPPAPLTPSTRTLEPSNCISIHMGITSIINYPHPLTVA